MEWVASRLSHEQKLLLKSVRWKESVEWNAVFPITDQQALADTLATTKHTFTSYHALLGKFIISSAQVPMVLVTDCLCGLAFSRTLYRVNSEDAVFVCVCVL